MSKDPKKGTGKKPKGSGRRLYTDENPKDTVKIKFATPADARATVAKVRRIKKPYARKIQILTVMEQRAKVMGKAGPAAVYRKYINAMKKKTKEMQNEDMNRLNRVIKRHSDTMKHHQMMFKKTGNAKHANAARDGKKKHDIAVTKQGHGKMEDIDEKSKGLWHNIHMRRKSGKRMRKKGEKGAPTPDALRSAQAASEEMTTTANIPNPADTAMGPRIKSVSVTDRRRKKDKVPVLLKRFRKYMDEVQ